MAKKPVKPKKKAKSKAPVPPPLPLFDDDGAAARAIIAAHGEHLVICDGTSLRFHTVDQPIRHVRHGARIVAVARTATRSAALDRLGTLHVYDDAGEVVSTRPVGDDPRSLLAVGERFVALCERGIAVVGATTIGFAGPRSGAERSGDVIARVDYPRGVVAAADPDGTIVIVGEERRLAEWTAGELRDIPPSAEQIVAIAPLGARRFLCTGQKHMFLLDLADREMESIGSPSSSPLLATSPSRVAWTDAGQVSIGQFTTKLERDQMVTYPGTYSAPASDVLSIRGLAFLDDERLAIALDHGRGNIISIGRSEALKLDEQPGDPTSRWVFIYDGKILVAG